MNKKHQEIWNCVKPLMKKVKKKDYVLHVKMVIRAMEEIIAGEGGNVDILIPAAILHDVGWSEVTEKLQLTDDKKLKHEAGVQHIRRAPLIIRRILGKLNYDQNTIERVIEIVVAHKFTDPEEKEKRLLIDADTLSDTYKESFYSDVESYNSTSEKTYKFRSKNIFYTKTAKKIFQKQLKARREEINKVVIN